MEKKQLEIGKDYGFCFGIPDGAKMIYNGGISWTGSFAGKSHTMDSQLQTDNALEYINRPSYGTGLR